MASPGGQSGPKDSIPRISSPRRLLILAPSNQSHATVPPFLHTLTGVPVTSPPSTSKPGEHTDSTSQSPSETQQSATTFAGYTTHSPLRLQTKYYTADIPIWVDEIPFQTQLSNTSASPEEGQQSSTASPPPSSEQSDLHWKTAFLSPEALEVRDVIGAVVVCIERPEGISPSVPTHEISTDAKGQVESHVSRIKEIIRNVAEVRSRIEEERGGLGEVPGLVVLVGKEEGKKPQVGGRVEDDDDDLGALDSAEPGLGPEYGVAWWDGELNEMGIFEFEVLSWDPEGNEEKDKRNEFGELEGMARIREVLETNEWSSGGAGADDPEALSHLIDSDEEDGFKLEADELEREMFGLRMAIEKGGGDGDGGNEDEEDHDELQVEQMDALMLRMQAIRDMGADLPPSERKTFAAKAIRDIMKDI